MKREKRWLILAGLVLLTTAYVIYTYWPSRSTTNVGASKSLRGPDVPTAPARLTLSQLRRLADSVGIDTSQYTLTPSASPAQQDRLLTALLMDVRYGTKPPRVAYTGLRETLDSTWTRRAVASFSPALQHEALPFGPYRQLVAQYGRLRRRAPLTPGLADTLRQIRQTLNFYRYTNRFGTQPFVLINIPAGELTVFDRQGTRLLTMPVIVGRPDQPTPCLTTYVQHIVVYPKWNVPASIALDEMLPRLKHNPLYVYEQNLQLIDEQGREVDPDEIDWDGVTTNNFPYRIRQVSGDENALGLLKFNLHNPLAIYLHDTNRRDLFTLSADRWRSHGCVRVRQPVELANWMLGKPTFDARFMARNAYGQPSRTLPLPRPVPVFIAYNTADVDSTGALRVYRDVYAFHRR